MASSGSGKKKGIIILIASGAIIMVQLLQMTALHSIKKGLAPGYPSEWMVVQFGFIIIGILAVLLILISMNLFKSGD
jgi:uncharacterized membrane protein YidH (DUF202 family)